MTYPLIAIYHDIYTHAVSIHGYLLIAIYTHRHRASPIDRFVVNKVLQPMETNDPYADDFYFLQLNIKKNNAARERAVLEQRPLPSAIYVPLPVWKETKERIKLQIEATRQSFHQKSREWEEKEMVRHVIMPCSIHMMHCMIDNWSNIYTLYVSVSASISM